MRRRSEASSPKPNEFLPGDVVEILCPLEYPENASRLREISDELAAAMKATVTMVDDDDLVLRELDFDPHQV